MAGSVWDQQVRDVLAEAQAPRTRTVAVDGREVRIVVPTPSPEDWRDRWIYFLIVDRFSNPDRGPKNLPFDAPFGEFQGGTFEGVRRRLGYLQGLGVGAIWLNPVLQNCQYLSGTFHGYGIQHFLQVDARLASAPDQATAEAELQALIDEAHARGMHVIFDIVLNHAGDVFAYVLDDGSAVGAADWRGGGYPIRWRDETGRPRPDWSEAPADPGLDGAAAIWPKELRRNEVFRRKGKGGEAGGDFESLKELVSADPAVRDALIRAYQFLVAKFDVDGFRIDTLKYIEPDFALAFGNAMREFALSIGKKNFFTFGEVYDDEEKIAQFIGRNAGRSGDLVGVDAALDFPLFFRLPGVAKGFTAPTEAAEVYRRRKRVEEGVISSHGEASNYFVTFLDNHDQKERFRFEDPADPTKYDRQVTLALACLYSLQGIPCLYYGTEQGLHGKGDADTSVREALWGKTPNAFATDHPLYQAVRQISETRARLPALRYGRQYFRPVSGDGRQFGISPFPGGVIAFSRILNDTEVAVVANTSLRSDITVSVIVDATLNPAGSRFLVRYSNAGAEANDPQPVADHHDTEVHEPDGSVSSGSLRAIEVHLAPGEVQILSK
jgi:glycosidase